MQLDIPIMGDEIFLRSMTAEDASDFYLSWMNDPDVNRYLEVRFSPPQTTEALAAFIDLCNQSKDDLLLGIFLRATDQHIGNIKLGPINWAHRSGEVGLLIGDQAQWGKGHAARAISLISSYAFEYLKLEKLTAGCYSSNVGSERAFLRSGYVSEGKRIGQVAVESGREDLLLFGRVNPSS